MREKLGTITKSERNTERGNTFIFDFRFEDKTFQGFGGWALGEEGSWVEEDFVDKICKVCAITDLSQVVGKEMIALFKPDSEIVCGIKNPDTDEILIFEEWSKTVEVMSRLKGEK